MSTDLSKNQCVRVVTQLDEDARASSDGTDFEVHLLLRIGRRIEDDKQSFSFKWAGKHDDLRDLLSGLKKSKAVELVAEFVESPPKLVAKWVRIDRMDFLLKSDVPLLPIRSRDSG